MRALHSVRAFAVSALIGVYHGPTNLIRINIPRASDLLVALIVPDRSVHRILLGILHASLMWSL